MPLQFGELLHEAAEAEAVVEFAHQAPHAVHAACEIARPLAELRGAGVAALESLGHGVGRELPTLEREQYAGRIKRIEKTKGIADEHPAVAGRLPRAVRIVFRGIVAGHLLADRN